ncbi:transmembrane protein 154 isoform X3 [Ascaphus truei]|uniref:transmembrane protein 154 isoform X3 n=1 Tax=Ascaphus truei TaxID=8439 RepID=UPI003F5AD01A
MDCRSLEALSSQCKLTHTEADDFSGNGDSSYIALNDRLTTQPTIKTNTELGNDPSVTDVTQGYVEDIEDFQLTTQNYSSESYDTEMNLSSILLYAAPVLVLGLLAPLIFFIVKHRRWKKYEKEKMENEDVKGPIFEEDTPSVMEIEMEELDKWMSDMKKNVTANLDECWESPFPAASGEDLKKPINRNMTSKQLQCFQF